MVRNILKWCDEEQAKAIEDPSMAKGLKRAARNGVVEGAVNAAVILGAIGIANAVVSVVSGIFNPKK